MELLGSYDSSLQLNYYQALLALLNAAIDAGDLSGGSAFDKSSVLTLEAQAQSFAALPTGTAGSRVTDESFNYPLSLLQARLSALQAEADSFTTVSGRLLDILNNETVLLDDILAGDALIHWEESLPQLGGWSYGWNFSIGQGPKSQDVTNVDPITTPLVIYDQELPTSAVFDCSSGTLSAGLCSPTTVRTFKVKDAIWSYTTSGIPQELYAPDMTWAQLDLLETLPRVSFPSISTKVIYPEAGSIVGVLSFVGSGPLGAPPSGGALPTYLRILFYPRRNQLLSTDTVSVLATNGTVINLSSYAIDPNSVIVMKHDGTKVYSPDVDFNAQPIPPASSSYGVTPINIGVSVPVDIYFTEYWPAYQCSMDQSTWSDIIMLDGDRLYRDDETEFFPISVISGVNPWYPLTDETGSPTGIYFQPLPLTLLAKQYTVLVTTTGTTSSVPDATSVILELDIEQPSYLNAINLSPFAAFPVILQKVEVEGLTSINRNTVFSGSFLVEGSMQIQFPRQIVNKAYLTMVQQNYTIKEYQEAAPDALQRNTMNSLQASLPYAMRGAPAAMPVLYQGYQYEYGFEDLEALDTQPTGMPGVFVQGPMTILGCPEVLRVDAQTSGTVDMYICYQAYDVSNTVVDENLTGVEITPNTTIVFPFSSLLARGSVVSVEVSMRFVLRTPDAVVSQYYMQATLR